MDDFGEGNDGFTDVCTIFATATGDNDFVGWPTSLRNVEDNIFLKHAVAAEGGLAGLKNVKAAKLKMAQEIFAEWTKIGAITETPGRDTDELSTRNQ